MTTKSDLRDLIAEENGITKKLAEEYIEVVFNGIQEALKQDDKVQLQGIITFEVKDTKAKAGTLTNKDGEKIPWETEAGKKVSVKLSKSFTKEIIGE